MTRLCWCPRASFSWASLTLTLTLPLTLTSVTLPGVDDKPLLVPESKLLLGFRIAVDNVSSNKAKRHVQLRVTAATDSCGRGVELCEGVEPRGILFDESPYLITPTGEA